MLEVSLRAGALLAVLEMNGMDVGTQWRVHGRRITLAIELENNSGATNDYKNVLRNFIINEVNGVLVVCLDWRVKQLVDELHCRELPVEFRRRILTCTISEFSVELLQRWVQQLAAMN